MKETAKLTILGCHSANPTGDKFTTSQVLEMQGHLFLIDCGEGTQMQLRKARIKFSRVQHIFISHLHGDHFNGLIGLISTFRLLGRKSPLHIYAPKGVQELITLQLKLSGSWTNYPLHFHELTLKKSETLWEDEKVVVKTIPLRHRIYTNGFLFQTKVGLRLINKDAVEGLALSPKHYRMLQEGESIELENGKIFTNEELTRPPAPVKSYAYCSDTVYDDAIVPLIEEVDLLYHESTFLEKHAALASETKHSTAAQAAKIAALAKVKRLALGHYSSRYNDKNDFLEEAKPIFENIILSEDLKTILF